MFDPFPFFHADDFETAAAFHATFQLDLRLGQRLHRFESLTSTANVIESPLIGFYGYTYSHDVILNAGSENPHYWIATHYPRQVSGSKLICRPASPGDDDPMILKGNSPMLGMRLDGVTVHNFIESYIGEDVNREIRFEPKLDAPTAGDAFISAKLRALAGADEATLRQATSSSHAGHLLESVVEDLLLFREHTLTAFVRRKNSRPAPRDVKRAIDFIHAYAHRNPRLSCLSKVANVPGRTLSAHFRDYVGTSPINYLRRVQLQNARHMLQSGTVETVARAAKAQGFTHLGRFSVAFARAFHERPSDVLYRRLGK